MLAIELSKTVMKIDFISNLCMTFSEIVFNLALNVIFSFLKRNEIFWKNIIQSAIDRINQGIERHHVDGQDEGLS